MQIVPYQGYVLLPVVKYNTPHDIESIIMYNYFIKTKKKVHKSDFIGQWMDSDKFASFLLDVKSKDKSLFIKSWRSKSKKGKK